jgi:hypothetical protein
MPSPPIPPIQPGAGGLSSQYQQTMLGYGALETGVGMPQVAAGGAAAMYQTASSQDVTVVRDDALIQLVGGLREDMARMIDMQRQFMSEKNDQIIRLQEQLRSARQSAPANPNAGGPNPGGGNPLAGMTTSEGHESGNPRLTQSAIASQIIGPNGNVLTPQMMNPMRMGIGPTVPWLPYGGMPFPMPNSAYQGAGGGQTGGIPVNTALTVLAAGGSGAASGGGGGRHGGGGGGGGFGGGGGGGWYGGGGNGIGGSGSPGGAGGGRGFNSMAGGAWRAGSMMKLAGNGLSSAGATGALGMLGKALPGVGIAVQAAGLVHDAVAGTYHEVMAQREAGRQIQEVEGGSNIDAQKERAGRWIGRFGHLGLSGEDYQKAWMGATQIGYRGHTRGQYIDTYSNLHNDLGMSGDDINSVMSQNAREANSSFQELASSLHQVTQAARNFNVNTKMMRDQMARNVDAAWHGGLGTGATGAGAALAISQSGFGRDFAGQDMTGVFGTMQQLIGASVQGMTPNSLLAAENSSPTAVLGTKDALAKTFSRLTPQAIAFIKEQAQGQDPADPQAVKNIAAAVIQSADSLGLPPLQIYLDTVWKKYTNEKDATVQTMVEEWVREALGTGWAATAKTQGVHGAGNYNPVNTKTGAVTFQQRWNNKTIGTVKDATKMAAEVGPNANYHQFAQSMQDAGHGDNKALSSYIFYDAMKGHGNGAVESLLNNIGESNPNVMVRTKKGNRVMPLSMAVEHYEAEVAQGNVIFMDGKNKGKSSSQVSGMSDNSKATTQEAQKEFNDTTVNGVFRNKAKHVYDQGTWDKDHPSKSADSNTGQVIQVSLSPDAKRLIQVALNNGSGNNPMDSSGAPMPLGPNVSYMPK